MLLRGARAPARHARACVILGDAKTPADLGEGFGHGLTAARDRLSRREEWARDADDVLWRRTKCGLPHVRGDRSRVAAYVEDRHGAGNVTATAVMQPLAAMPDGTRRAIRGVLTDIDDTLSTHGRLTARRLRRDGAFARRGHARDPDHRPARGLVRPHRAHVAGRCRRGRKRRVLHALRRRARRLVRRFVDDETTRAPHRDAADAHRGDDRRAVPGCALASDQRYRETDLAIDFCEDVAPLPRAAIDRIVALMQAEGMTAKVSSIHVNGWFGSYDKLTMTRSCCAEAFAIDIDAERDALRLRRRFAERCADVRVLSERGGRGQRARVRRSHRHAAGLRDARRGGRGLRGARELSAGAPVSARGRARRHSARERASAARPANAPLAPNASSMRSASFHFAIRSERANEPTLSCPAFQPTARCTIDTSSVSPERADTIVREARGARRRERGERFRHRARLVGLDEHGIARAVAPRPRDARGVRREVVVADDLDASAGGARERDPAVAIVLGRTGPRSTRSDSGRSSRAASRSSRRGRVRGARARADSGRRGRTRTRRCRARSRRRRPGMKPARSIARTSIASASSFVSNCRPPAAFVGDAGELARVAHQLAGRAIDLGGHLERLRERRRADRHHHQVLDVDAPARVRAAAENLDLGQRQRDRPVAGEVAPQRNAVRAPRPHARLRATPRPSHCRRGFALFGVPSSAISAASIAGLIEARRGPRARARWSRRCSRWRRHVHSAEARAAVAQIDRLARAARRARGSDGASARAAVEHDFGFDVGRPRESQTRRP